jgi:hypothetical protein
MDILLIHLHVFRWWRTNSLLPEQSMDGSQVVWENPERLLNCVSTYSFTCLSEEGGPLRVTIHAQDFMHPWLCKELEAPSMPNQHL